MEINGYGNTPSTNLVSLNDKTTYAALEEAYGSNGLDMYSDDDEDARHWSTTYQHMAQSQCNFLPSVLRSAAQVSNTLDWNVEE